jgi:arylsulfatase A-like enzyme
MIAAALLALAVTALIETLRVPVLQSRRWPELMLGAYALSLVHVAVDLAPSVLFLPLLGLINAVQQRGLRWFTRERGGPSPAELASVVPRSRASWLASAARLVLIAVVVAAPYRKLILYPAFARYAPAWLAFGLLFVALVVSLVPLPAQLAAARSRWVRALYRYGLPLGALVGAAACYAIDMLAYKGDYPTLHVSVLQIGHLLLSLGLWRAASLWPARVPALVTRSAWALAAALAVLAPTAASSAAGERAYPYWSAHTTLGQTQTVFRAYREPKGSGRIPLLPEARAAALFRQHSGLPPLAEDFDLLNYNVLLLVSEATRFDQTSLASKALKTTPALRKFHKRGAASFSRAYSPSSGTYQSVAGMFGMSYPSFLDLQVWQKPWQGEFVDEHPLPAELFAAAGYDTFWIGHNKETCFTQTVLGFNRGFKSRDLLSKKQSRLPHADELIARMAIEKLRAVSKKDERFFGWVFFVAPHSNYKTHYPDWPAETALDRYRQEVRFFDEQIGKVLAELDKLGRLSDTIVIYTADHGEEFLEHGGRWHKSTIYTEVTNVPLLIWVPGMRGGPMLEPTSTSYLFPWLLQRGSPVMRKAALHRLRRDVGPVLERTGGAVVTELLGPHRMLASLIYPTRKFNYDFNSKLHQAYRIDRDRLEQRNLFETDPELTREAEAAMLAYREVRAERHAFVLRPDRKDPRPEHK